MPTLSLSDCIILFFFLSNQVLRSVRADRSLANDGLSSALLVIYLDSAKNLPVRFCNVYFVVMQEKSFCSDALA